MRRSSAIPSRRRGADPHRRTLRRRLGEASACSSCKLRLGGGGGPTLIAFRSRTRSFPVPASGASCGRKSPARGFDRHHASTVGARLTVSPITPASNERASSPKSPRVVAGRGLCRRIHTVAAAAYRSALRRRAVPRRSAVGGRHPGPASVPGGGPAHRHRATYDGASRSGTFSMVSARPATRRSFAGSCAVFDAWPPTSPLARSLAHPGRCRRLSRIRGREHGQRDQSHLGAARLRRHRIHAVLASAARRQARGASSRCARLTTRGCNPFAGVLRRTDVTGRVRARAEAVDSRSPARYWCHRAGVAAAR